MSNCADGAVSLTSVAYGDMWGSYDTILGSQNESYRGTDSRMHRSNYSEPSKDLPLDTSTYEHSPRTPDSSTSRRTGLSFETREEDGVLSDLARAEMPLHGRFFSPPQDFTRGPREVRRRPFNPYRPEDVQAVEASALLSKRYAELPDHDEAVGSIQNQQRARRVVGSN